MPPSRAQRKPTRRVTSTTRRSSSKRRARKPKDARLAFNAGDAAYRAGHYDAADAAFKRALAAADPKLQQQILYNEGRSLPARGGARSQRSARQTIAQWKAAIKAYDGAIALDAKDADAKFNRDFVKRKLDALERAKSTKKDERRRTSRRRTTRAAPGTRTRRTRRGAKGKDEDRRVEGRERSEGRLLRVETDAGQLACRQPTEALRCLRTASAPDQRA